ncbi:sensor histidine kinase [Cohnella sp. GCM10020058]|uniref:sensor histidine kinase n=1 Tax=Cohnella sp. GCM10020058 TaxID=3317330 RepID=UPI003641EB7D
MKKLYNVKLIYLFILLAFTAVMTNVILQAYYYVNFDLITRNKADDYFSSIIEQVQGRVETTQKEIQNKSNEIAYSRLLQEYLNSPDKSKKAEYFPLVVDYISNVIHSTDYIKGIRVFESRDHYIGTNAGDEFTAVTGDIFKAIDMQKLLDKENALKKPLFTGPYRDPEGDFYYYAYVQPIFKTMPGDFSFEPIAIGVFICSADSLQALVDSIPLSARSVLAFSLNDTILSTNREHVLGRSLTSNFSAELAQIRSKGEQSGKTDKQLLKFTQMKNDSWSIFLSIPVKDITTDTAGLKQSGLVISILELLFFLVAGFFLIRVIYRQISHLLADIVQASRREGGYRLQVRGKNEVGIISLHINGMLRKIESANESLLQTQERLYATELEKKQSEVNALHSQINPHFLYNTLECIRSIAKYRAVDEIAQISSAMAHIFRYSIKADDFVALREELDILNAYFKIMNIRFQERFAFEMKIEESLLGCGTFKMLLQPIVENAFYHGLENSYDKGTVTLTASVQDERIVIIVSDNGIGMPPERLASLNQMLREAGSSFSMHGGNRSIGLENIAKRIALIYGPAYGLTMESEPGLGTTVKIEIPKIRHVEAEHSPSEWQAG